ncbi:MAG: helix-turn-helix transcriptional regulator [Clostridia bacterium]|nr:helix-turn-helix transcriptional regulator [Clostridia bacterium]
MEFVTIGRNYPVGKIVPVKCVVNDRFDKVDIKDQCFLLVVLTEGNAIFKVGDDTVSATAPCFICFNERAVPELVAKRKCKNTAVYFHPQFLNLNMTFDLIRLNTYEDIASVHDMFLLKPFMDEYRVIPIAESYMDNISSACSGMVYELSEQRDWYWTCRGRSYFMEVIIALERMYDLTQTGELSMAYNVKDHRLREAILFIEGHYFCTLSLEDIVSGVGVNHTTLTNMFRDELGISVMEYLTDHRIKIAKRKLSFTFVPIKDIAKQCGFKTVQHFTRVFKKYTNETPANYRNRTFEKRVSELG